MFTATAWTIPYVPWASFLMWPTIYAWGKSGKPVFNAARSLADPPVFTVNSTGDTVASITLKRRHWSDGRPVTTRDVQFWMNLLQADKTTYAAYVPGEFPTNIKKISYTSSMRFTITFDAKYSTLWLLGNVLTNITPIPQHAWDRTASSGPVGNYDTTTSGARSVYKFLEHASQSASTLGTNPLWKVVDGPWKITSFAATSGHISFAANPKYPWPQPHRLSTFTELPYTSTAAEMNALESGALDVGYVPYSSIDAIPSLKAKGFKIVTWNADAYGGLVLNYAPKNPGAAILDQLYVRQAFTHLIDMRQIMEKVYHGRASYASSPVPNPANHGEYLTATGKRDPYPYDVAAARRLLQEHGWKVVPNGVSECVRPGIGRSKCGKGIAKGQQLKFEIVGTRTAETEYSIFQYVLSQFATLGVKLSPKLVPEPTLAVAAAKCSGSAKNCSWNMMLWITGQWPWGWETNLPSGTQDFLCGATSNYDALCNPENDRLIKDITTSTDPISALKRWENFMAKEQFQIFFPMPAYRIVAYKKGLHGVLPLTPFLNLQPTLWHF